MWLIYYDKIYQKKTSLIIGRWQPWHEGHSKHPKGLYKKARAGEIKEFTGIDSPYEIPKEPAMIIDTKEFTINESADELFNFILKKIPVK